MIFTSTVPLNIKPDTGIITYLAQRFTYFSRELWSEKISQKKVAINGNIADNNDFVRAGDTVTYDAGEFEEPAANLDYKIVYEDQWFLGVNKPGNLLVHRAGKSFRNNLIYQLRFAHNPTYSEAHSTHRLDRDTSGVLLVAKNSEACTAMGIQFANRALDKEYIAIVHGHPKLQSKDITIAIGKSISSEISYKYCADPNGKPAHTVVEECKPIGTGYSLLRLHPLTGRTHQIRVHCAAIGHPIVGDKLYAMDENAYKEWRKDPASFTGHIDFYRHALHCKSIGFVHPYTNEYTTIDTALPEDMKDLITRLERL